MSIPTAVLAGVALGLVVTLGPVAVPAWRHLHG